MPSSTQSTPPSISNKNNDQRVEHRLPCKRACKDDTAQLGPTAVRTYFWSVTMWVLAKRGSVPGNASKTTTTSPGKEDPYLVALVPSKPSNSGQPSKQDEVTVRLTRSALNHRDNWMTKGMYPQLREGVVLGSDGCGVAETGDMKGKRVVLDPSMAWGADPAAPHGTLEILGMPRNGTFQASITVPAANVHEAPKHLTDSQAAALPLAGVTAYRALVTKGRAKPGDLVLVTGIGGGVAVFAAQFAAAMGCKVYVTSSSQSKVDRAVRELGCAGGVLYTAPDWTKKLLAATGNQKFAVVIDGGGGDGLNDLLRVVKGGARVVTYGSTAGPSVQVTLPLLFLNNVDLLGTAMGSPSDFAEMLHFVNKHKIVPIVDEEFPFTEFPQALDKMRKGQQLGKLVLVHGPAAKL